MLLTGPRTIYAQGLLLISIPLLVQLVFGLTMFALQRYDEDKLNKERTALEIIDHANEMLINCSDVMMLKGYCAFYGGPEPAVAEIEARLNEEYHILMSLVSPGSAPARNLEQIRTATYESLKLSNHFRPLVTENQSGSSKLAALRGNLDTFSATWDLVSSIGAAIERFSEPEFLHSAAAAQQVEKSTALIDRIVLAALGCSTLVAILLFVYFIRSINQGVQVMVENTERFKRGEALKPPLEGGDEIARVDAAFHGMAEEIREAQRTKQAIMAMVSHDLRTPLGSVLGYFSLLTSGALRDTSPEAVAGAENQERKMERLMRLICDLLDLERIEAERLPLCKQTVAVSDVMETAIEAVDPLADWKGVIISAPETSEEICADPDRIVQVLTNLLSCAIRLSPGGSTIDASVVQQNGDVEISISSPSTSVDADVLNGQFDRYQPREAGLGLELPVSKEIIRLHNGTMGASTQQPQGCTLWFRLPALAGHVTP